MTNPGIASAAIGVVAAARAGMASGINTTFRQVGIATGVAGARRDLPVADRLEARRAAAAARPPSFADAVSSGATAERAHGGPAAASRAGHGSPPTRPSSAASTRSCWSARRSRSPAPSSACSWSAVATSSDARRGTGRRRGRPGRRTGPRGVAGANPSAPGAKTGTRAARAADREPAADRARRAAPRRGSERDHRRDRGGQDGARPLARPADGRPGAAADRPPGRRRGLGRGRLRPAGGPARRTPSWPSSPSGCPRTPTRSCSGAGSAPPGGPAPSSPGAPPRRPTCARSGRGCSPSTASTSTAS